MKKKQYIILAATIAAFFAVGNFQSMAESETTVNETAETIEDTRTSGEDTPDVSFIDPYFNGEPETYSPEEQKEVLQIMMNADTGKSEGILTINVAPPNGKWDGNAVFVNIRDAADKTHVFTLKKKEGQEDWTDSLLIASGGCTITDCYTDSGEKFAPEDTFVNVKKGKETVIKIKYLKNQGKKTAADYIMAVVIGLGISALLVGGGVAWERYVKSR
jgi:hypothetical protein